MATVMQIHRERNVEGLEDNDASQFFAKTFNDVFEILNRKTEDKGLVVGWPDFDVSCYLYVKQVTFMLFVFQFLQIY